MDLVSRVADAYLQTAEGSDAARLHFLEGLWEIQSHMESADRHYDPPDAEAARDALVSGQPLFLLSAPVVPTAEYAEAASRIACYVSEAAGLSDAQADALRGVDFAGAVDAERLAGAVLSPNAFVAEVANDVSAQVGDDLTPATLAFVLISALAPFLTGPSKSARETLGESDGQLWTAGQCPVCGSPASMGRMGESSQLQGAERALWCGLCHAEWGYERIRCVRCGCRNSDRLRYSHLEGDPAHRLHLCEECHGYTRFVFVDDLGKSVSMVVEDAVTATLDAVALAMGYTATGDAVKGRA